MYMHISGRCVKLYMRLGPLIVCALSSSGCLGTLGTRSTKAIGAYPYEAVYSDVRDPWREGPSAIPFDMLSLPFDIVVDTVLLPFDSIGWCFGQRKSGLDDVLGQETIKPRCLTSYCYGASAKCDSQGRPQPILKPLGLRRDLVNRT
jgi:uncharacterized protein YceK